MSNTLTYDKYLIAVKKWRNTMIIKMMAYDVVDDTALKHLEDVVSELKKYESYLEYQRWSTELSRNDE